MLIEQIREENADKPIDTDIALSDTNLFEQNDDNLMVGATRREDIGHIWVKDLMRPISPDQSRGETTKIVDNSEDGLAPLVPFDHSQSL